MAARSAAWAARRRSTTSTPAAASGRWAAPSWRRCWATRRAGRISAPAWSSQMAEQGVAGFTGCYASPIALAATQEAAKYGLPFCIDSGLADSITTRGLKNVFRLFPNATTTTTDAIAALDCDQQEGRLARQDRRGGARGRRVRHQPGQAARHPARRHRHQAAGDDPARDADARLHQHRAAHQGGQAGPGDPGRLHQRIRAADPHAGAAEGRAGRASSRWPGVGSTCASPRTSLRSPRTSSTSTTG